MLLSAAGDALGFRNQLWEYNPSGPDIHQELQALGGLGRLLVQLPDWPVSDDTVLHLATAEALATGQEGEGLLQEVAFRYVEAMKDMEGRKPGPSSMLGVSQLRPGAPGGYRIPYNPEGSGCGAAMRSMCIGLRYPRPEQLRSLVSVAMETGRMTHPHPTGFLGAVATALFTAYAAQRRPVESWGAGLLQEALPLAMELVQSAGYAVEETLRDWSYFTDKWSWYLSERGISSGAGPVQWPAPYGPAERDLAYKSFSLSGWAGRSGHDAPMIALDALLGAGPDWEELLSRAAFHGGDSDSTAVIACCCWGLQYGLKGVPAGNYCCLEYRSRIELGSDSSDSDLEGLPRLPLPPTKRRRVIDPAAIATVPVYSSKVSSSLQLIPSSFKHTDITEEQSRRPPVPAPPPQEEQPISFALSDSEEEEPSGERDLEKQLGSISPPPSRLQGGADEPDDDVILVTPLRPESPREIVLKFRCRGDLHKITVQSTSPLGEAVEQLSVKLQVPPSRILLLRKESELPVGCSASELGLGITDIIDCVLIHEQHQDRWLDETDDTITVRLQGKERNSTRDYRVLRDAPLGSVLRKYVAQLALTGSQKVSFLFDGSKVSDSDTPSKLEMEDGDVIEVWT
ncbi:NFATC2-interacting protein isoform X2 [Lepisosteus oculatus]|uniref:NFATC2-interacting protein isoform X2 n=1 Tax=Lepisosteus oculatus TaxID=7918 RepID=UPI00371FC841